MKALSEKVLFLGVDGMDPLMTKRLVDEGKMPHTKELIARGACREDLQMLGGVPTITPPMWTTLATGASPNVHGITCYWQQSKESLEELEYAFNSHLIKAEPLWNVTAQAGKKTLVFHWPVAWPPTMDDPNLSVIDGTTPGCVNMGVAVLDPEKIVTASTEMTEVKFKAKVAIDNGAGCVIHDIGEDDAGTMSLSEKSTSGRNLVNLEMSFSDGEGSFEEMQMDMINSPITDAQGWAFAIPADSREFIIGMNKGLVRRYGLIVKNEQGVYDTVRVYRSKKEEQPITVISRQQDITFDAVDTFVIGEEEKSGCCFYALMDLAEDASFVRVYIGPFMDINGDHHFQPRELYHQLVDHAGYIYSPTFTGGQYPDIVEKVILPSWKQFMDWQAKAINYAITEERYEVIFSHMHNIDAMGHQFWHWCKARKRNPSVDPAQYMGFLEQCYQDTDDYIGQFLPLLDDGWTIFLFSDHGFMTNREEEPPVLGDPFGVNVPVLQQLGYTVLKKDADGNDILEIDWSKTRAVAPRGNYIWINLKGRNATGIVDPADKYDLEEQIISDLYNYRDPETGKRIVYLCMRNKEAALVGMDGPDTGDIIYWINEGFNRGHGDSMPTFVGENGTSVAPIFIAAGAGIKAGIKTSRVIRQIDMTPTAAVLLGVRMPETCEGAPVYQIIAG